MTNAGHSVPSPLGCNNCRSGLHSVEQSLPRCSRDYDQGIVCIEQVALAADVPVYV